MKVYKCPLLKIDVIFLVVIATGRGHTQSIGSSTNVI